MIPGPGAGRQLGIRPEDIELCDHGGVPARLESADYLGADTIITACVGEQTLLVRQPGRVHIEDGGRAALRWAPQAMHLFDATSGNRVEPGEEAERAAWG